MARGLRVQLLSERRMRSQLQEWLKTTEHGYNEMKQLILVYYGCAKLRGRIHLQPINKSNASNPDEPETE